MLHLPLVPPPYENEVDSFTTSAGNIDIFGGVGVNANGKLTIKDNANTSMSQTLTWSAGESMQIIDGNGDTWDFLFEKLTPVGVYGFEYDNLTTCTKNDVAAVLGDFVTIFNDPANSVSVIRTSAPVPDVSGTTNTITTSGGMLLSRGI